MPDGGFNPPAPSTSIRKTPVLIDEDVELQHENSKLFMSKFGQWYRVGGDFNRDMLPPEVGSVPFPHKIVSAKGKGSGSPLESGDLVRIRTTQNMPPANLTMIGVKPGQNWSLCKHWGDGLVQFYFTEDERSLWQIHRVAGSGPIHYGDTIRLEKVKNNASEGWLRKTVKKVGNEFHADLESTPTGEANWVIYPKR